jgi:hypothetical protein
MHGTVRLQVGAGSMACLSFGVWRQRVRKSLEDTWRYLETEGDKPPRQPDGCPVVPAQMPSYDDAEPLGLSYYKSGLEDVDRSDLAMPRTYFGRSGFYRVRFAGGKSTNAWRGWSKTAMHWRNQTRPSTSKSTACWRSARGARWNTVRPGAWRSRHGSRFCRWTTT